MSLALRMVIVSAITAAIVVGAGLTYASGILKHRASLVRVVYPIPVRDLNQVQGSGSSAHPPLYKPFLSPDGKKSARGHWSPTGH